MSGEDIGDAFAIEELEVDREQAFAFYNSHYANGGMWVLDPSKPLVPLGDMTSPRVCRFCRRHQPEVSFRKVAHAIPELLGNKTLFVCYECDACNQAFGNSYEHHLGAWTKPLRTMSRMRGKKGVPSLEIADRWSIKDGPKGLEFIHESDDPDFILDEDAKTWTLTLGRDDFRPLFVLKAFVRMGLALLPEDQVAHFSHALEWVRDIRGVDAMFEQQGLSWQFQPGPPVSPSILATLMFRRDDYTQVPYCMLFLAVGSFCYQVAIPSKMKDWYLQGKAIKIPWFPTFDKRHAEAYGAPIRYTTDFSSAELRRDEKMRFSIKYESRRPI